MSQQSAIREEEPKNRVAALYFGDSHALAMPIDRNNFTFIYQKWRTEVMPRIDAPWDVLKKKYALYDRDFFHQLVKATMFPIKRRDLLKTLSLRTSA